MNTIAVTRRFDLTDAQWARLEPLLPTPKKSGRPSAWTKRQLIDGIRWRVRVGSPWRDVPDCYGSWQAVYGLFRCWQRAGVWARIVTRLQARADAAGLITWDVSVGSTIARAHQHAAGARREPDQQRERPGGLSVEPTDHALGRSRTRLGSAGERLTGTIDRYERLGDVQRQAAASGYPTVVRLFQGEATIARQIAVSCGLVTVRRVSV